MTLLVDKIRDDLLQARRARATEQVKFLATLLGEVSIIGKNAGNRKTSDSETQSVVKKFLDGNTFTLGKDVAAEARYYLELERDYLQQLMPKVLTDEELTTILKDYLAQFPGPTIGTAMTYLKHMYPNRYDGAKAKSLVQGLLV